MNTALLRDLSSVRMTILQSLFGRGSLFRASKTLFDGRENRRPRSVSAMCVLTLREEPVSAGIRTFAFRHWNTGFADAHKQPRACSNARQLLEHIWDVAGDFVNDNTLTVYIKRLREKLEADPQTPCIIKTVRGVGYKID